MTQYNSAEFLFFFRDVFFSILEGLAFGDAVLLIDDGYKEIQLFYACIWIVQIFHWPIENFFLICLQTVMGAFHWS